MPSSPFTVLFGARGAAAVAAQSRMVGNSLRGITGATRMLRAGLMGVSSMVMGAQATFVVLGLAIRQSIRQYSAFTNAQAMLRTTLATSSRDVSLHASILTRNAMSVGRDLGYSTTASVESMNTLIETGANTQMALQQFRTASVFARAGNMAMADSIQFLTDLTSLYNREMVASHETQVQFSERMAGQVAVAAARTSTTIEQLRAAFRMAGAAMVTMGYDSRETTAALAGMSTIGIRGSQAGYTLRSALVALRRPARATIQELSDVAGISFREAESQFTNLTANADGSSATLIETMDRLQVMFREVGTEAGRQSLAVRIFGRSAINAGSGLSGLTVIGDRIRQTYEEMSNPATMRRTLEQMKEERMRSFAMQVTQATEAVNDLAISFGNILFGSMQTSEQGLGSYLRQLADGVSILGSWNDGNAETRDRWRQLSPEIRENARILRQFMLDMNRLIHTLARVIPPIVDFISHHQTLSFVLLGVVTLFGGLGGAISTLGPIFIRGVGSLMTYNMALRVTGSATQTSIGATIGLAAAVLAVGDAVTRSITAAMRNTDEYRDAYAQLDATIGTTRMNAIESVPLIGGIMAAFVRDARLLYDAIVETGRELSRFFARITGHNINLEMSASEAISSRRSDYMRSGMSESQATSSAQTSARNESMQRWAALAYSQGINNNQGNEGSIRDAIHAMGIVDTAQITAMADFVGRYQRTLLSSGMMQSTIDQLQGTNTEQGAFGQASVQLQDFQRVLGITTTALRDMGSAAQSTQPTGFEVPGMEDGYVRRGGLVNVATDDLVVNRTRLASVIRAGRGDLAGVAAGGGGGDMTVTVPVIVDGREIARATGRAAVRQLERGGARIAPGQRRSLRETGSERRVG